MTATDPVVRLGGLLSGQQLARVTRLYLASTADRDRNDGGHVRRIPALAAAYHAACGTPAPFLFGWIRLAAGGPVTILTTTPLPDPTGEAGLRYPPGANGVAVHESTIAGLLTGFAAWTRIALALDPLIASGRCGHASQVDGLEDLLLDGWPGLFAWLVYAEPVAPEQVADAAGLAAEAERDARTRANSPTHLVRADRLAARHRELRAGESTGVWRTHLLVGGADEQSALAFAGLLAAAHDLNPLGYALVPSGHAGPLDQVLHAPHEDTPTGATSPIDAGSPLLAALACPPAAAIPGVQIRPRSTFDVTPPENPIGGVPVGQIVDRSGHPAGKLQLAGQSLVRHTFVTGATGSGKSTTVQHLLTEASRAGLAWLVIEPAKAEYRTHMPGDVTVVRVGDPDAVAVGLNPLQPAPGFALRTHADMVKALFVAAFHAGEPFPQILSAALDRCYTDTGWDLTLGEPRTPGLTPRWPTLTDLRHAAEQIIVEAGYGGEVAANVRGFVSVRLASLSTGTVGRFFAGDHQLDLDTLLRRNVILELEDVGDDTDKAFLMGAFLLRLTEHLRVRERHSPTGDGVRHLTVIEEAHRLLRRPDGEGPAAHAVETFAAMLAEIRAYGEGLIIADQIPAKLIPDTVKNTATKIVHRLPARDDRDIVGATMNLTDDQSAFLVTLPPGTAAVFADGMHAPVLVQIPPPQTVDATRSVSPPGLITTHSAGCPPDCATTPRTLRQQAAAQQLLHQHPTFAAWADLAVLAHLLALPAPTPGPQLLADLEPVPGWQRELAIGHGVAAAVHARTSAIATTHSPDRLTAHVAAELRGQLRGQPTCPDRPDMWWAPTFRFNPIRRALLIALHADPGAPRHADSVTWERQHQRPIPGATGREQLAAVAAWSGQLARQMPAAVGRTLLFGAPPRLVDIMRVPVASPGWTAALDHILAHLPTPGGWPRAYLSTGELQAVPT